jgi:hypothetical protein
MYDELFTKATQLLQQLGGGDHRLHQLSNDNKHVQNNQLYTNQRGGQAIAKNQTDYEQYKLYKKYKRKYKELVLRQASN